MASKPDDSEPNGSAPRPWQTPRLRFVGDVRELIGGTMKSGPEMDGDTSAMGSPKRGQA